MKRSHRLSALVCSAFAITLGLTLLATNMAAQTDRPDQWKKVEKAIQKGLPKSAIEALDPIIASAIQDKAYPEAIKALAQKIQLEGTIQGNKPEEKVTRLAAEIAKAPAEMKPVLQAILAHSYWQYFQQNRWRFVQRTQTGEAPGSDFTTWDLPRIFLEIDKHFTDALSHEKELKAIPIATYNALLEKGAMPDAYRPTLFDFLAFDALAFYTSPEQAGAKVEDEFTIPAATSPIFAPAAEFLAWKPQTTDATSRTLQAVRLFQKLLDFHKEDKERSAFLDADLHRLQFGYNTAVGDEKAAKYKAALAKFADENGDHALSARARFHQATVLNGEGDKVEARKIAMRAVEAHRESPAGKLCANLILEIEQKQMQVATERVWAEPMPDIMVTYRNLSKVHFRLVKADFVARLKSEHWRPDQITDLDRKNLIAQKPAREWSEDLPATPDYKERTERLVAPKGVPAGFYFLLSSHNERFTETDNVVSACDVWSSNLAIVSRHDWHRPVLNGFVLNATTGEPIDGADVQTWVRNNRDGRWAKGESGKTDRNGQFNVNGSTNTNNLVIASDKGDSLASGHDYYLQGQPNKVPTSEQTVFFTDRSLYRPGQTIQFKGICLRVNQSSDNYETIPNRSLSVLFKDVNGKEISILQVRTNDYGSFAGSFTAPRDRLTGRMTIVSPGSPHGATNVSVEEYKRPKFEVKLEPSKEPAKLNAEAKLPGQATSYTGVPIGGAKIRYRVVREVRYPDWWWGCFGWWRPQPRQPSQEIAHGDLITEADGRFVVSFTAKADPTVREDEEPTFRFTVHADVTDTTGETRSDTRSLEVGFVALRASILVDEWLTANSDLKLRLHTSTLDGVGEAAKGTLKIFTLKQPAKPARLDLDGRYYWRGGQPKPAVAGEPPIDPSKPATWALGELVHDAPFTTDGAGTAAATVKLPVGAYRAILETRDAFGKKVTARVQLEVIDPSSTRFPIKLPNKVAAPTWTLEPGQQFLALWGTGYEAGRAFIEVEHRGKLLQAFWTKNDHTQEVVKEAVTEAMRGGFTLRVTQVIENRGYFTSRHVDVPWTNKDLTVKWEHFVSKLEPGKKETYTAVITGPNAKRAAAEMVAAMYDQSLDAYLPHEWIRKFSVFRQDYSSLQSHFENVSRHLQWLQGQWNQSHQHVDLSYRSFPATIIQNLWGYEFQKRDGVGMAAAIEGGVMPASAPMAGFAGMDALRKEKEAEPAKNLTNEERGVDKQLGEPSPNVPKLDGVAARTNLNETAFFFPHLVADQDGTVRLEFTMPEALTKWKFLGFVHDRELRSGYLQDSVVTAKDLMAQPNPPRFLRENDKLVFPVKLTNKSATAQTGRIRLTFKDARTNQPVDTALANAQPEQSFELAAGESKTFLWPLTVSEGVGPLVYKVVAASDRVSDGEEGMLPVLSNKILVAESLPLPIRGKSTRTFEFKKLLESGNSATLKSQTLTVQMTSQPAWYAVMALPYLMEFPHECSEQTFNRLYANSLARHIAASDPKIRRVFDQWKNTPALDSPLEKNQDLKAVMLDETPWVRQAAKESEARRNVGVLFDENRLNTEVGRVTQKLAQMQNADGLWPWFPGGPSNEFITLYITTGYGRLRHLGVQNLDVAAAVKSLHALDAWMDKQYQWALAHDPEKNHLSTTVALYLYGRSFFLADKPVAEQHRPALTYWQGQAKKYWLQIANRQSQAHIAVGLKRLGDLETARGVMASIRERSVSNEELGMFWRETELSWWWYRAPIETQAMMVEAFDEVANDKQAVEDCKVWLLKQKQTQDWKTTKATADAVYALLLRGTDLLKSDALVSVTLGDMPIKPVNVEAGTGFFEQKFVRGEIKPAMGTITVTKPDEGVSWGAVHWTYLEDISKVTPHDGTPLNLEKKLFKRIFTKKGPVLEPVNGAVAVGDEIVCRIVLRTDRDMEYVHMKDHRGSGTEPVNVLSKYKYQDGLAYYESTKDTATHFFIDYLPKGTYVFEYALRVQHKGEYPSGLAHIECMYAPEFNSHSESIMLEVK